MLPEENSLSQFLVFWQSAKIYLTNWWPACTAVATVPNFPLPAIAILLTNCLPVRPERLAEYSNPIACGCQCVLCVLMSTWATGKIIDYRGGFPSKLSFLGFRYIVLQCVLTLDQLRTYVDSTIVISHRSVGLLFGWRLLFYLSSTGKIGNVLILCSSGGGSSSSSSSSSCCCCCCCCCGCSSSRCGSGCNCSCSCSSSI